MNLELQCKTNVRTKFTELCDFVYIKTLTKIEVFLVSITELNTLS